MTITPHSSSDDGVGIERAKVIIIGTGFSGLGLAVQLRRSGETDFVMLERAGDVGGTWRDNTYPGAACDIQSHLYSYSFRPNAHWSRVYATQPEIRRYLQDTAREEGIYPHIHFNSTVTDAVWDDADAMWTVTTPTGIFTAPVLVSAAGHLSDPAYPDIDGIGGFAGEIFHSARWNHDADLTGKRIGVIGTGASAIQIVPEIQKVAGHLTVFQRSAPYIVPRRDHVYSAAEKGMVSRLPKVAQRLRDHLFWENESRLPQRRRVPTFIDQIRQTALGHMHAQVCDPDLREKLTPHFEVGCKRILISNDYYPAISQDNVTLATAGIASIDTTGVVLANGEHVDLDVLVVATGFEAADLPIAKVIRGRNAEVLSEQWQEGGKAFACATVNGFPNLFVMLGPNTGLGAGSIIYMVETQIDYIRGGIEAILRDDLVIEPDPATQEAYVQSIYERSEGSVWVAGGCSSWYLHPRSGRLTTLWPDFMSQFRRENGTFDLASYQVSDSVVDAARP
ncbi:flavin-containing monooxygenase [Rhodococcus sp. NPDC057529]|uniref:flavin-containing monooxygenase n=1 Tax=Rhodococcus sp. NPDC057529 TaxID=3346158 RepID=UPI003672EB77